MARNRWIKIRTNDGKGVRYVRADRYEAWKQEHLNDTYGSAARNHFIGGEDDKGSLKWNFDESDALYNGGSGGKANGFLDFFSNLFTKWSGTGMTDAEKDAADYNTQVGRENMELEKQMQLEIFNQTQSYEAQVRNMQAAGLNPALMFNGGASQSSVSGPSAQAGTATASPSGEFPNILGLVKTIMGASQLKSENKLRESQSEKNIADANAANAAAGKSKTETEILEIDKRWAEVRNRIYTNEGLSRIKKNLSDITVNNGRIRLMDSEVSLNFKDIKLKDSQILVNEADAVLKGLDAVKARKLLPYAVEYYRADIMLKNAQTEQAKSSAISLHANALVSMAEAMIKEGLVSGGYVRKFLDNLDADTLEKSGLANLHTAQTGLTEQQTATSAATERAQNAQADYTETSQNFIVADKLIGYWTNFITLSADVIGAALPLL
nr:MAG: DNA pilot protein [Microviridae sp.]